MGHLSQAIACLGVNDVVNSRNFSKKKKKKKWNNSFNQNMASVGNELQKSTNGNTISVKVLLSFSKQCLTCSLKKTPMLQIQKP